MIKWRDNWVFGMGVFCGVIVFTDADLGYSLLAGFEAFLVWCAVDCFIYFVHHFFTRGRS